MKFTIKQMHPSPEFQQQQQENHGDQEILKKEVMEEEHKGTFSQLLNSVEKQQPSSSKSSDTNQNVSNITTTPVSLNLGKRKRRPKLLNAISPVTIGRRKKKKPSDSKAITDSEGKRTNKKEKPNIHVHIKSPTLIRAEAVKSSLGNEFPSFIKMLVRSHVGSCFWMGLPVPFCKLHLPKKDTITIIENENNERFEVKYIAEKTGLSAGWRKFVTSHKLVEGDALIFLLIGPTTFKVHVTRANDINEENGALSKQNDAVSKKNKKVPEESVPLQLVQKKKKKKNNNKQESGNESEELASEVTESTKCSDNAICFKDVKNFKDFRITINGVCIDSELPEHIRIKYYELCCIKNCFLHELFLPGLHYKLAAGMIFEAVNTAEAIKACKITTPKKEFEKWDKSLESFEILGLKVGFLRDRVRWLISLSFDAEEAVVTKKYRELKSQRTRVDEEIKDLERKIMELLESYEKYDFDIDALKSKAESYELMFQQEVNAPW